MRQSNTLLTIVRLLGILLVWINRSSGFLSPSSSSLLRPNLLRRPFDNDASSLKHSIVLFAQRQRKPAAAKKKNNNKRKLSVTSSKRTSSKRSANSLSKKKSPTKQATQKKKTTDGGINTKIQIPGKSSKKNSVPWQVLSTKDAKRNAEKEKERRRLGLSQQLHDANEQQSVMSISKKFLSESDQAFLNWKRFNPTSIPKGMRLVASVLDNKLPPQIGVPEIAFLGRSNVGKSSLLNKLASYSQTSAAITGANDKARVGKTPGATASVNLYALIDKNEKPILGFVDLPGFGYAKLSKSVQQSVQQTAERYLGKRNEFVLGILLLDIRRLPSDDDKAVLAALYDLNVPILVVATKIDKISSALNLESRLEEIRFTMGLPEGQPLCVSSVTGEGTKKLWQIILEACESGVEEFERKLLVDKKGGAEEDDDEDEEMFEDSEDLVYDQGYDWIHDSAIMYDDSGDEDEENDGEEHAYYAPFDDMSMDNNEPEEQESIKSLKKKARRMERSGEV